MDINDITEDQKAKILHHFRAAVLARAVQWDHELAIEAILGHEIDIDVANWACNVDETAGVSPDNLTFVEWEDIAEYLTPGKS